MLPPNQEPLAPFAFFRSYRFPDRILNPATGNLSEIDPQTSGIPATVNDEGPSRTESSTLIDIDSTPLLSSGQDQASAEDNSQDVFSPLRSIEQNSTASPTVSSATSGSLSTTSSGPTNVVVTPLLIVGVRAVGTTDTPSVGLFSQTNSEPSVLRDGPSVDPSNIGDTQNAGVNQNSLSQENQQEEGAAARQASSSSDPPEQPVAAPESTEGQFLLFLTGGIFPANSPMLHLPFLFSEEQQPSYEDFLRLAELLGSAKPSNITKEELAQANLVVVDGGEELKELERAGRVLSNTTERCLICLSEYEGGEQVRVLDCKHCFHTYVVVSL